MELKIIRRYLPKSFFNLITLQSGLELILIYTAINKMSGVFGLLSLFTNHPINFMQWTYYVLNIFVLIITILCYLHIKKLTEISLSNNSLNSDSNLPTIKILAFFVFIFISDFFTGNFFMIYLTKLWFKEEYSNSNNYNNNDNTLSTTTTTTTTTTISSSVTSSNSIMDNSNSVNEAESLINDKTIHLLKRVSSVLSEQSASEGYEIFVTIVTVLISEILRLYFISITLSYYLRLRKRINRPCSGWGAALVNFLDKFN